MSLNDIGYVNSRVQTDLAINEIFGDTETDLNVVSTSRFQAPCAVLIGHRDAWHDPTVTYAPEIIWVTEVPSGTVLRTTLANRGQSGTAVRTHDNSAGNLVATLIFDQRNWEELATRLDSILPTGLILMWSGSIASIPSGWALCDGANGTPDLRGRFVVGAGGGYAVAATGGADAVTLTTSQIPGHTHSQGSSGASGIHNHRPKNPDGAHLQEAGIGDGAQYAPVGTQRARSSNRYMFGADDWTEVAGNHTHTNPNTNSTGGGGSHENRPPYYALAYIMKV